MSLIVGDAEECIHTRPTAAIDPPAVETPRVEGWLLMNRQFLPSLMVAPAVALLLSPVLGTSPALSQTTPFRIVSERLQEGSGLALSKKFPGVLWTHNDSGDSARFFAIDQTGKILSEWQLAGARNQDWEDLAIDDQGNLYVGDIGNNANARRDLAVYVVAEPDPHATPSEGEELTVRATRRLRFRYPDFPYPPPPNRQNYDAESLFWAGGELYLLSKHRSNTKTQLYRFASLEDEDEQVLLPLGKPFETGEDSALRGGMVTAADITEDGQQLAIMTYHNIFVFDRPTTDHLSRLRGTMKLLPAISMQCEGITWDGNDLLFSNEQGFVHRIADARNNLPSSYPAGPPARP